MQNLLSGLHLSGGKTWREVLSPFLPQKLTEEARGPEPTGLRGSGKSKLYPK